MRLRRALQLLILAVLVAVAALWPWRAERRTETPPDEMDLVGATLDLVARNYISVVNEPTLFVWAVEALADGVVYLNDPDRELTPEPETATEADARPAPSPQPAPSAEPSPAEPAEPPEPPLAEATPEGDPPAAVLLRVAGAERRLDFQAARADNLEQLRAGLDFAVEHGKINDRRELLYFMLSGMLQRLDPHSEFQDPDEVRQFTEESAGSFGGIGIEIGMRDRILTVIAPIDGTPADIAGIEAGDRIRGIDGKPTENITLFEAVDLIRGPQGTRVTLSIERAGLDGLLSVPIERATIEVEAVKAFELGDGVGYVRLRQFNHKTEPELRAALKRLSAAPGGLHGLVLDLRNNPGGLLSAAIDVSDAFLERGVIVSTRGRTPGTDQIFEAARRNSYSGVPLVVLTNFGSASASEIVAGALQDSGRGLVVGGRTFGKGSVQSVLEVDGQGNVILTTSMYYTPSGRSIQAWGIMPDVQVFYSTDEGEVDRPFSEEQLEGFLPNAGQAQPPQAALRVDAEKLHWFMRNAGRVKPEIEAEDPDSLMVLAHDLLLSSINPTPQSMLAAARVQLAPVDKVVVPPEEEQE